MVNLKVLLYEDLFCRLRLGTVAGRKALSKPIFLMTVIKCVGDKTLLNNKLHFDNNQFINTFKELAEYYNDGIHTAFMPFFIRPFFHLSSEPFYELIWKPEAKPHSRSILPSAKFLRENLAYAKLDDDLWEILQESTNREYLKQAIIAKHLNKSHQPIT